MVRIENEKIRAHPVPSAKYHNINNVVYNMGSDKLSFFDW